MFAKSLVNPARKTKKPLNISIKMNTSASDEYVITSNIKSIDEFYDSSDDEDIVNRNSYPGISDIEIKSMAGDLTFKRLQRILTKAEILNKPPRSHQDLIKKNATDGDFHPETLKRETSIFVAPLRGPAKLLDALPSRPNIQETLINTVVPSFRGIKWSDTISREELFFSTRASWIGEHNFSSKTFAMTQTSIAQHTKAFVLQDEQVQQKHKNYNLSCLKQLGTDTLQKNNKKLIKAANKWKKFFKLANNIKAKFSDWKQIVFNDMRDIYSQHKRSQLFSLEQIFSYYYVNDYYKFKMVFESLPHHLNMVKNAPSIAKGQNILAIGKLIKYYDSMHLTPEDLKQGMPYLSEGQIPRHALLYGFGLKCYSKNNELHMQPLYENGYNPERNKIYLGKLLVAKNPNNLFSGSDRAKYIPNFGNIISPMIIGEMEIQHSGANLQGTVTKHINLKLPKFHYQTAPSHYITKYGLNQVLYDQFKKTFSFLIENGEHGKLSWMYLETVLLAHLIHFHEIQLLKYTNLMAEEAGRSISWSKRNGSILTNPF